MRPAPAFGAIARGFTLIELMIATVVVAILAAIAIASYSAYITKARRSDAKNALLDLAAREERYFTANNQYGTLQQLNYSTTDPVAIGTPQDYAMTVVPVAPSATVAASFTATATPYGTQVNDACGTYQVTDLGAETNNPTPTSTTCW